MSNYLYRGVIGHVLENTSGSSLLPVYHLYDPINDHHFYTSDYSEAVAYNTDVINGPSLPTYTDRIIMFSELPNGILKKQGNDIVGVCKHKCKKPNFNNAITTQTTNIIN